jgi:hypothetical protein
MKKYASIKQLVIDQTISNGQIPPYEELTKLVLEHFPTSRWKESHYAWYRSKFNTGGIDLNDFRDIDDVAEQEIIEEQNAMDFAVSLEKDLQIYLANRLNEIEEGLILIGTEYKTGAGFIDILCKDKVGNMVVIETKAGKAKDAALGQILGYIGALKASGVKEDIRGILVASEFDSRVVYAIAALGNIILSKYSLSFKFEHVTG